MQDAPVVHPLMMLLVRVNEPPRFSTPVSAPTIVMFLTAIEEPPSILIPVPHESTWLNMMAGDEVTPETSIPVPQSMRPFVRLAPHLADVVRRNNPLAQRHDLAPLSGRDYRHGAWKVPPRQTGGLS